MRGLTYVISYNVFPVFRGVESVMIGASAGVMSVLFYLASYSPQMGIRIFFFDIKIIYIALFLFFYDIIQIPLNNSGGHIAHIGGAIWGYYYCISNNKGEDFTQSIFNIFKTTKKKNTKASQNNNNFDQKRLIQFLIKSLIQAMIVLQKKKRNIYLK
ncbi:MAG: hypothetical protein CM15mP102_20550 [Flavobacteriales bacterium]|nr:MAG: hypothetical protein CM15mP102_20550 [Flavobacteriales bacterium]